MNTYHDLRIHSVFDGQLASFQLFEVILNSAAMNILLHFFFFFFCSAHVCISVENIKAKIASNKGSEGRSYSRLLQ